MSDIESSQSSLAVELAPDIWRVVLPMRDSFTTAVNVYLIRDTDGFVLVDTGLEIKESRDALDAGLAEMGISADAIHTVIATHGHHDHYGLAALLRREHGTRVWLHESDWAYIRIRYADPDGFREMQFGWMQRYGVPAEVARSAIRTVGMGVQSISIIEPDRALSGGEIIDVGKYRFEIQWTPGHTPGHVCLLEPDQELLFSGDHILPNVASNVSLQPYSSVNPMPGYISSLKQLAETPIRLTMPGHGDLMRSVADRAHKIAQHQLDRRDQLLGVLTQAAQTPYELAAFIWADSKPNNWDRFPDALRRNAVGTLVAHLEQLADEGLVRRTEDETVKFAAKG